MHSPPPSKPNVTRHEGNLNPIVLPCDRVPKRPSSQAGESNNHVVTIVPHLPTGTTVLPRRVNPWRSTHRDSGLVVRWNRGQDFGTKVILQTTTEENDAKSNGFFRIKEAPMRAVGGTLTHAPPSSDLAKWCLILRGIGVEMLSRWDLDVIFLENKSWSINGETYTTTEKKPVYVFHVPKFCRKSNFEAIALRENHVEDPRP
ncbi:hypothetical protein K438DRAFT_1756338 [Mycena galopus ATCC 62051]|nr:hypothetical protein K438DRAFT_1756338 [Mycena galopus ATCC 62051]